MTQPLPAFATLPPPPTAPQLELVIVAPPIHFTDQKWWKQACLCSLWLCRSDLTSISWTPSHQTVTHFLIFLNISYSSLPHYVENPSNQFLKCCEDFLLLLLTWLSLLGYVVMSSLSLSCSLSPSLTLYFCLTQIKITTFQVTFTFQ